MPCRSIVQIISQTMPIALDNKDLARCQTHLHGRVHILIKLHVAWYIDYSMSEGVTPWNSQYIFLVCMINSALALLHDIHITTLVNTQRYRLRRSVSSITYIIRMYKSILIYHQIRFDTMFLSYHRRVRYHCILSFYFITIWYQVHFTSPLLTWDMHWIRPRYKGPATRVYFWKLSSPCMALSVNQYFVKMIYKQLRRWVVWHGELQMRKHRRNDSYCLAISMKAM